MAQQPDLTVSDLLRALPIDAPQPVLQGSNPPVGYDFWSVHNGVGYADREGFEGYALQFADETKGIVELEAIDRWATELASMLYTYRSIARALPTVTGSDEGRKKAMYSASFEVLHPAISRVKVIITFKERACTKWISNLALLVRAENKARVDKKGEAPIPCEALYFQLLNTLDMLAVLDATLDTKACLNNDFSAYKRAFAHCRSDIPDAEQITNENGLLQPFLAVPQTLLTALRVATHKIPGFDTVLADMATLAIESLENDWYLLPHEKHRLLRCAAHALWLLDSPDKKEGVNAFTHKRIKRDRFGKWFRRYPIVPMYGDMFANLQHILSSCPNWPANSADDFFAVSRKELAQVAASYDLPSQLPALRMQVASFSASFPALLQRIKVAGGGARCMLPRAEHTEIALTLRDETLRGCRLMSQLSCLLREAIVYKCNHTCPEELLQRRSKGAEVTDYERALRYNLSAHERSALIEILAMLKGLQSLLQSVCGDLERLLQRAIHELTQRFVHETMGGPMRKSVKYEKKALKAQLLQLRNMCADWSGEPAELMDEKRIVSKEFKFASHAGDYPARVTPPSQTQVWLMRATTRALYDERSPYIKSSLMNEADLPKANVSEMKAFVNDSAYFGYLLRLSSTLSDLGDVSCLWMREFYLELCKRVQFPISMSLPAILTEHVLSAGNSYLMPMLLYAFDGYSDAGLLALHTHAQQHLYVEIEAEANLVFDQVLYSLSEKLFAHFKTRASSALLAEIGTAGPDMAWADSEVSAALGKNWFLPLCAVRSARILGRSVDLSRLITQRMNTMVRQSLDLALARYESKSLDGIIDLHRAIQATRLTHNLIAEVLPDVDPFDACFLEATDSIAFLSFSSRALTHTISECLTDLIPNFAFRGDGSIFQRPLPTPFTQPPERDAPPRMAGAHLAYGTRQMNAEFAMHAARSSGVFGARHAEALVAVLGEGGVQSLLASLNTHIEQLLLTALQPYVAELQAALPESTKLPSYQYGAQGCYLFFEAKLKDLANYEELHSGVLHSLRRLGNCLALLTLLESATHCTSTISLHQLPLKGTHRPMTTAATAVSAAWGQSADDSDLVYMSEQISALSAPLASSSSLITRALINATSAVVDLKEAWLAGESEGSDLSGHEETRAFHRVWSCVSFLYATAPFVTPRGTVDNSTLFGDGTLLAGSFLLHALCQRHRFELLDFSSHVFAVHVADSGSATEPSLQAFVHRVSLMKKAHDRFSAMLEASDAPTIYNVWRRM